MILIEDNGLIEISLQSTYLSPLLISTSYFVQAILEDHCRISKNSALYTASLFYSIANQKHAGMTIDLIFSFNFTFQLERSIVSIRCKVSNTFGHIRKL